jgi:hypothetical protein
MPNPNSPFSSEYVQVSGTAVSGIPLVTGMASSETSTNPPTKSPFGPMEAERYGTGKPKRVVMRGKITSE